MFMGRPLSLRPSKRSSTCIFIMLCFLCTGVAVLHAASDENWDGHFDFFIHGGAGFDNVVRCISVKGGAVFAGGDFIYAGGEEVNHVAYWNGYTFAAFDSGLNGSVRAIALDGYVLYAGGNFTQAGILDVNHIARWDGDEWSALGAGFDTTVCALAVFDGHVYAGGRFKTVGGDSVYHIARWNGSEWSPLGSGVNSSVHVITVHGDEIYVGGTFTKAGGITVNGIARWAGDSWSPVGGGVSGSGPQGVASVDAIRFDGGGDCYVGGNFTEAGGVPVGFIARWDGSTWDSLGPGLNGRVFGVGIVEEGVVAGGGFNASGDNYIHHIGLWNGSNWVDMGNGTGTDTWVFAVEVDGPDVYFGGDFTRVNAIQDVGRIARWRNYYFYTLENSNHGMDGVVTSLVARGENIFACGSFHHGGCTYCYYVGMWNGDRWFPLGSGTTSNLQAVEADSEYVYIGGHFTNAGGTFAENIARWDGNGWLPLGPGIKEWIVYALDSDGENLCVGGEFTTAGFEPADNVAKWDGLGWSALGSGTDGPVYAVAIVGDDLYAGGDFETAGGITVNNIARWNGSAWEAMSSGTDGPVYALASHGTDLYVGGSFMYAGYELFNNIARWNGSSWSALGSGLFGRGVNGPVRAIDIYDGAVYAGGGFTEAGGDTASRIAVFTGDEWLPLGSGVSGEGNPHWPQGVRAFACTGDGDIFVGGNFEVAGGKSSMYIGLWHTSLTAVDEGDIASPRHSLSQNYPNPFNPHTVIRYEVQAPGGRVSISIYNVGGRLIKTLINAPHREGVYEASWSGLDERGRAVASGVYFCRMLVSDFEQTRKLVLLR
ncbi:MAG: T9SS type A sorting domain-containing protein [bacterium]|nr:MAG: T9SS type A sorting domain-containing protein [bacterium]